MNVSDFDFELPEELIALKPARPRDSARLLVVRPDRLEDRVVRDLPEILKAGDVLVANDSRVIKAALSGTRASRDGGADVGIDVNLNRRLGPSEWSAFARPAKRLKEGDVICFGVGLEARVIERDEGLVRLVFNRDGEALDAAIDAVGTMPLPPYIGSKRPADAEDEADYQTTFANERGSVAAPTAGLHFTPELFDALEARGVKRETVTLHVNAGTFLPVSAERTEDHRMHPEFATLTRPAAARINSARAHGGRCIPVGTTALRTLESAMAGKPLGYNLDGYASETSIFITPGYKFRATDGLMTNFHLPKSTLFMLVSALMGLEVMQRAYRHAIEQRYRFFSYGDACLLLPNG